MNIRNKNKLFYLMCLLQSKVWSHLENFNGEKYPKCVKMLLIASGYDTLIALNEIDQGKLAKIQDHINENRELTSNLKCCYGEIYKKQTEFHFLPGHKATILGIKNQIAQLKESSGWKERQRASKHKSEDQLKTALVVSLDAYASKCGLPKNIISAVNIIEFHHITEAGQDVYKCGFSCLFCDKVISVKYKTYWMTSNATKHILYHTKLANISSEEGMVVENS